MDTQGFEAEMKKQKDLAKKSQKFVMDSAGIKWKISSDAPHSNFIGYSEEKSFSKIVNWADVDDKVYIVLDKTPFYAESGGQIGDTGAIENQDFSFNVLDTQRDGDFIIHVCSLQKGSISQDMNVSCQIDSTRRGDIKINHSATHLLHQALKDVLGDHVNQAGSGVQPDYRRLDITHPAKLIKKKLKLLN